MSGPTKTFSEWLHLLSSRVKEVRYFFYNNQDCIDEFKKGLFDMILKGYEIYAVESGVLKKEDYFIKITYLYFAKSIFHEPVKAIGARWNVIIMEDQKGFIIEPEYIYL